MKNEKAYGYIYLIIYCLNDKEYVGQTTATVDERFRNHCSHQEMYIDKAIRAYGRENFLVVTLKECDSQEELDKWERWFIFAKGCKCPFSYNIANGGNVAVGWHHAQETCKKIGESLRGRPSPHRKCPFKNLLAELDAHGITTYTDIAVLLSLSYKTAQGKLRGKTLFTDEEKAFLVDYLGKPAEYLFARDDGKSSESKPKKNRGNLLNYKSPYQNLLTTLMEHGITKYIELAEPMEMLPDTFRNKMRGRNNFTDSEKNFLADYLGKPIEYLFACDDAE